GNVKKDDILNYVQDFKKNLSTIIPSEYQLNFKASGYKVLTQDLIPMLKNCFEMYKQANFKKIYIDMGGNVVQKMQVKRVVNSVGLSNFEIV
ncbi:MAG: hypothetical protein G4V63_15995, partial [Candidatus Afipia apatlaquensis]|nr:hypothetical protein [Candidatus Afipia apatlaquensis]